MRNQILSVGLHRKFSAFVCQNVQDHMIRKFFENGNILFHVYKILKENDASAD
jgi:hypothetical protein